METRVTVTLLALAGLAYAGAACGEADRLVVVPEEPRFYYPIGTATISRETPVLKSLDLPDRCNGVDDDGDGTTDEDHELVTCEQDGCFGAVLCRNGQISCFIPSCELEDWCKDPIDWVWLLDRSGSMGLLVQDVAEDLAAFYLKPEDRVTIVDVPRLDGQGFSGNPLCGSTTPPLEPCQDIPAYLDEYSKVASAGAFEPFFDAIAALPWLIKWRPGASRRVLLVTDEPPSGGQVTGLFSALVTLTAGDYRVYTYADVGYEQLASRTGGRHFPVTTPVRSACQP
jgi:hypothetical protein